MTFSRVLGLIQKCLPMVLLLYPLSVSATNGIECGCAKTGDYVNPSHGVAPQLIQTSDINTGTSPNGKYRVTSTPLGSIVDLTVTRISTSSAPEAVVLTRGGLPVGANWGFSPDDDRFVYYYQNGSVHNVFLHNLARATPNVAVKSYPVSTLSARVQFSPNGRYLFYSAITGATRTLISIVDAQSGAKAYETEFNFQSPPGSPGDAFGTARWGFSPDDFDRTFVYAYVSGQSSVQWNVVNLVKNLSTGLSNSSVHNEPVFSISAFWQFSPCGDLIGIVTEPNPSQVGVRLFRTLNGTRVTSPHETFSLAAVSFRATAVSQIANVGGTDFVMAANTADDPCPGGGGGATNNLPTAAFTLPVGVRQGIAALFTDRSTDIDGTVVAWLWNFGDGGTSTVKNPTYAYATAGTFNVSLQVTDDRGATGSATRSLTVAANNPPVARFRFTPSAPRARDIVTFTDTSTDDDGIVGRFWSFGASGPVALLKVCATLDVTLTVSDGAGQSARVTQTVLVSAPSSGEIAVPAGGSLADAVESACPGDTLRLDTGTFTGGVRLTDLTLQGAGAGRTIISGGAPVTQEWVIISRPSTGNVNTIQDLTISGGGEIGCSGFCPGGGGVYAQSSGITFGLTRLVNVEVRDNNGSGGIYLSGSSANLEVRNSFIHHNTRLGGRGFAGGGGISIECCGTVLIKDSEISFNTAANPDGDGGGIFAGEAEHVSITGNFIHDNSAARDGGGLAGNFSRTTLVANNRIVSNLAARRGGGVAGTYPDVLFVGNLVAGNTGGGVFDNAFSSSLTVANSTIVGNTGDGLAAAGATIVNSIIAGNTTDLVGTAGSTVSSLIGTAPTFRGPGDYHLAMDPSAVDAGDNAGVPQAAAFPAIQVLDPELAAILAHDADGDLRILDGNGDRTAIVDIGYDEATPVQIDPRALSFDNQIVGTAGAIKTVTLTHTGTALLNIQGIALGGAQPGDFIIASNSCGSSLAPGGSCVLDLRFAPSAIRLRTAELIITDDAAGSPRRVALSGMGIVPTADLSLTKTDSPDPTGLESNLTYTIVVTNNGPDPATGVVLTDALPAATMTYVSSSASQGSCSGTSTVTCSIGTLANGAQATVQIVVRPRISGFVSNTASVTGNETDPHPANNSARAETRVDCATCPRLEIAAIEVTQGIQFLGDPDQATFPDNSVPLIEDKMTLVRVYFKTSAGVIPPGLFKNITGGLYTFLCGGTEPLQLSPGYYPNNRPQYPDGSNTSISDQRGALGRTLNFLLPRGSTRPCADLQVSVTSPDASGVSALKITGLKFEEMPRTKVRLYNLQIPLVDAEPRLIDRMLLPIWLARGYPISNLIFEEGRFWLPFTRDCWLVDLDLTLHKWLNIFPGGEDPRFHYYAMQNDAAGFMRGCAIGGPVASGPTGVPTGTSSWDLDGSYGDWYGAHELGHTFGRPHVNAAGTEAGPDPNYPYPGGTIGPSSGSLWGLDLRGSAQRNPAVIPSTWWDIMSYGAAPGQWVSDYTYKAVKDYLMRGGEAAAGSGVPGANTPSEHLGVLGVVNLTQGTVDLDTLYRLPDMLPVQARTLGSYSISLFDSLGATLAEFPFTPYPIEEYDSDGGDSLAAITELVPHDPNTARIVILKEGIAVAEKRVSPNAPTVTMLSPLGGEILGSGAVRVEWQGSDADGDPLTFHLFFSADGGKIWQLIASRLADTRIDLPVGQLKGTDQGVFMVLASDGVNTGRAMTPAAFVVPRKAPEAVISPNQDFGTFSGEVVILSGLGLDREDGLLDNEALEWTSSRDGFLGTGSTMMSGLLSEGVHLISLTTTDSDGNQSAASIRINVTSADTIPPVVTPPISVTLPATESGGTRGTASSVLVSFLSGGSAVDAVDPAPARLAPQVSGVGADSNTLFPLGTTPVTFRFRDASGNIGSATANVTVAVGTPRLSGKIIAKGRDALGMYFVDLQLTDTGTGNARNIGVNQLLPRTLSGSGTVSYNTSLSPALPLALGSLDVGASTTVRFYFNVPSTVTKFSLTENGTVQDVAGTQFNFSIGQAVIP